MTLQQLESAIVSLFPTALPGVDFTLTTDGSGNASIALWNNAKGAEPTSAQLTTALATLQLTAAQQAQLATLGASFNAAYTANVTYNGSVFPSDAQTQQLLVHAHAAASAKGGSLPSAFYIKDVNGVHVTMTAAQLNGLLSAIFDQSFPAWDKMNTLEAEVKAATSVADVQVVVW